MTGSGPATYRGRARCELDTQEGQLGQDLRGLGKVLFFPHLLRSENPRTCGLRRTKVCKSCQVTEQQKYYHSNNSHLVDSCFVCSKLYTCVIVLAHIVLAIVSGGWLSTDQETDAYRGDVSGSPTLLHIRITWGVLKNATFHSRAMKVKCQR